MQLYRDANFSGETYCLSLENDEFLLEDVQSEITFNDDTNLATIWRVKLGSLVFDREELCGFFSDAEVSKAENRLMDARQDAHDPLDDGDAAYEAYRDRGLA